MVWSSRSPDLTPPLPPMMEEGLWLQTSPDFLQLSCCPQISRRGGGEVDICKSLPGFKVTQNVAISSVIFLVRILYWFEGKHGQVCMQWMYAMDLDNVRNFQVTYLSNVIGSEDYWLANILSAFPSVYPSFQQFWAYLKLQSYKNVLKEHNFLYVHLFILNKGTSNAEFYGDFRPLKCCNNYSNLKTSYFLSSFWSLAF
jgi:hypothetical protein